MTKIALKAMAVTMAIAFAMPAAACMDPFTWPTPDDLSGNACDIGDPYFIEAEAATGWKAGESGQFQFAAGSAWPEPDWPPQPTGPHWVDFGAGVTMVEVDTVPKPVGSPFADGRTMVPFATGRSMEVSTGTVWPKPPVPDATAFWIDGTTVNADPARPFDSPFAPGAGPWRRRKRRTRPGSSSEWTGPWRPSARPSSLGATRAARRWMPLRGPWERPRPTRLLGRHG